jgi:hypothetical protein
MAAQESKEQGKRCAQPSSRRTANANADPVNSNNPYKTGHPAYGCTVM